HESHPRQIEPGNPTEGSRMPRARVSRSNKPSKALVDLAKAYVGLPTGSFNERYVHDFLRAFADARGLEYREDAVGNAVIEYRRGRKTARLVPLVLGAHTDHP